MTETKHEKFLRLSKARTEKAVFGMGQLLHLTSHHYEFSEADISHIVTQLQEGLDTVREAFGLEAQECPEPEPRPEPVPAPAPVSDAPRTLEQGPLELNQAESLHLIRVGPQIGAAINAIEDGKSEEAYDLLLNLMRS